MTLLFSLISFFFLNNKTEIRVCMDQSNLNYMPKRAPVVMIAVICIVGIDCCFRTYDLGHL